MPAWTVTALTPPGEVGSPLPDTVGWPWMATGVAVTVQSAGTFPEPEPSASTTLAKVSVAGLSVLVIVQVMFSPTATSTMPPAVTGVALPVQTHAEAS